MIKVEEALKRIHSQKLEIKYTEVSILNAEGHWLANDIYSPMDLPVFDNSAMDGYAVRGNQENYQLVGEVAAGQTFNNQLKEGEACRIFTGAKVPASTTAVIMQEKVKAVNGSIHIEDELTLGKNIRKKGEELSAGELVLARGQKINSSAIGLLAALGIDKVTVCKKPKIAVITIGDELVEPGKPLGEGQIYEANGSLLESAIRSCGFPMVDRIHLLDDERIITAKVKEVLYLYDVIIFSGGISVGDYDFVGKALDANGVEEIFYKVKQKPGKPIFFGKSDSTFVFGLPGNPASSLTCFYIYVLPLLQKHAGARETGLNKLPLKLSHGYQLKGDRPAFLKGYVKSDGSVIILDGQSSSMLFSLSIGNALVLLPHGGEYDEGTLVDCYLY